MCEFSFTDSVEFENLKSVIEKKFDCNEVAPIIFEELKKQAENYDGDPRSIDLYFFFDEHGFFDRLEVTYSKFPDQDFPACLLPKKILQLDWEKDYLEIVDDICEFAIDAISMENFEVEGYPF